MTYMETSGPPHSIRNESPPSPLCDCGKKHSCHRHVMQSYDCWSLETLRNEDGIKEGDILENVTYLTVSQYFNQNLGSPLYSDLLTWLNPKPRGGKSFWTPCRGIDVWGHAPPDNFEN